MADLRTEVHHLEKDLSKERLKSRALEEELKNPLNIHRWRKLEVIVQLRIPSQIFIIPVFFKIVINFTKSF